MAAKKQLTKVEIIDHLAKNAAISKVAAKTVLESFVDLCVREVKAGRSLRVSGLGIFSLKKAKARKGINPRTGEALKIPAKKRMSFKSSAQIQAILNPSK